jgi:peroxiredoxin
MIRILTTFLFTAMILSCDHTPGFVLNGQLSGAGNEYVYLARAGTPGGEVIDSTRIEDGSFRFTGRVETPEPYILSVKGFRDQKLFFLENGVISFTGSTDSIYYATIAGSVTDSEYSEFESVIRPLNRNIITLFDQYHDAVSAGNGTVIESVGPEIERIRSAITGSALRFVKEHPASFASPWVLLSLQADLSADSLDKLTALLVPEVKMSSQYRTLRESIDKMHRLAPGNIAPDFSQPSHTGTLFTLSEATGRGPLLIYFWASWCTNCSEASEAVATLNRLYADRGLQIVAVSLDYSAPDWMEAVKRDSMEWINLSDLNMWGNGVAVEYNVTRIPYFCLVDSGGAIVARFDQSSMLDSLVVSQLAR